MVVCIFVAGIPQNLPVDMFLTVRPAWSPHGMVKPSRKVRQCSALEEEVGLLWKNRVERPGVTSPSPLCMISAR